MFAKGAHCSVVILIISLWSCLGANAREIRDVLYTNTNASSFRTLTPLASVALRSESESQRRQQIDDGVDRGHVHSSHWSLSPP